MGFESLETLHSIFKAEQKKAFLRIIGVFQVISSHQIVTRIIVFHSEATPPLVTMRPLTNHILACESINQS